jgi:hypothetical protein
MSPTDRNDSGYNFSSTNAEVSRANRRRNIIEGVEKRLSDLRGVDPPAKTEGSKEPETCKTMKRGRPYRSRMLPIE